jgi:hypothetical protein
MGDPLTRSRARRLSVHEYRALEVILARPPARVIGTPTVRSSMTVSRSLGTGRKMPAVRALAAQSAGQPGGALRGER